MRLFENDFVVRMPRRIDNAQECERFRAGILKPLFMNGRNLKTIPRLNFGMGRVDMHHPPTTYDVVDFAGLQAVTTRFFTGSDDCVRN